MIVVFVKDKEEIGRFECSSKLPDIGNEVRIASGTYKVENVVYEFFGKNDRHLVEIQVI